MQTFKRRIVVAALLFGPMTLARDLNSQLATWFSQRLAEFSDEVVVTIRTSPNLLPSYEQSTLNMSGSAKLRGNVNVLARCANEKRYLQVNAQTAGDYIVTAASVTQGSTLTPASITLKRGRLGQLSPRAMLDMSQVQDTVNLRDLVPGQPVQLSMLRQAWRTRAGQRVLVITNGDGLRVNAEGEALNNATVIQNARVQMISDQVVSGVADSDESILINL